MAKPQRRAVSPLRGEVRWQKHFCPLQTCSPHSKPSQPPLGAWRAGRVHPHLFSVWKLGDALSFPRYSPCFRRRRAACLGTQSILPCSVRTCRGFTDTGRGQTAKAFLPASNVFSSLKTVTATPRGLACGSSSSSFILGLAVGGRIVFPLLQSVLSPPAGRVCGDTVDSPLQRSDPVLATCQSSTSHSINPDKDAKGSPSWRRVPLLTIRSGYTFQFGEYPPRLDGVSTDGSKQRLQGFCSTAVAFLPPTERSDRGNTAVGHRTRVLQPKGYGGLRPILDLRRFNFSLYKGKFKMLTMRTIMSQVQEGDWFVTIDLKDAYFHIQVVLRHRRFLRFAFGGKAYQCKVLPFGLALAPRTFTKCMDAALAPLRLQGIRVLNYLDDWLILAHSRELVSRHRDIVLGHIHSLGLRMNAKKSVLLPSQRTVFLGVRLDSVQMQARLAPARIPVFTACLARFKLGHHVSVGTCRRLLGLMAAASPVLSPRAASHEAIPLVDEGAEVTPHCTSYSPYQSVGQLLSTPVNVARPRLSPERGENGCDPPSPYDHDGRINDRLGCGLRRKAGEWRVEGRVPLLAYKLPGTQGRLPGFEVFSPRSRGASYHSQDGQYGGCVPHKPPRGLKVAHPGQACAPSSPLVPRQIPLLEGGSRSGSTEPGKRPIFCRDRSSSPGNGC